MLQSIFSAKWTIFSMGTGPKPERISLYMQVQQQIQIYSLTEIVSAYCSLNSYDDISFQKFRSFL